MSWFFNKNIFSWSKNKLHSVNKTVLKDHGIGFHQILWLKLFVDVYGIFDFFLCTIVFCCFFFSFVCNLFSSLLMCIFVVCIFVVCIFVMCIFVVCSQRPFALVLSQTFFFMICKASQRTWIYLILFTGMTL